MAFEKKKMDFKLELVVDSELDIAWVAIKCFFFILYHIYYLNDLLSEFPLLTNLFRVRFLQNPYKLPN